ncbi:MAG: hypothetical protein IJS82_00940 [Paludibacteraceae bacterium]|nr:hypothetical protein [Paludibacteraceae bacterium]
MLGYYITYSKKSAISSIPTDEKYNSKHIDINNWHIERHTLHKFQNHKFFIDEPAFFFSTDGVILNRDELLQEYNCETFTELVGSLYHQYGETFFTTFRGSFSGVFYDKEKKLMLVFVDHTGSRLLFWEQETDALLISSDVCWLSSQTHNFQWDQLGLYEFLTYGFMPSHHTIVKRIRRLPAGCYLRINGNTCEQIVYHRFSNNSIHRTEKEEIQGVDKLFRQAVQRVLNVNKEYGYRNIFPLSAGLDSRMANWVAQDLTDTPIENFTYGIPNSLDVTTAQSITSALSRKWYFRSQEGAKFYSNIDTCIRRSGLLICCAGVAEATDVIETIPIEQAGMILTGILGDEILTSKLHRSSSSYSYGECALSSISYPEQKALIPKDFTSQYATRNIFHLYAGFERHAMGSPLAFQHYTESYSPFLDADFIAFVFSTPESHRKNYRLYDKWVLSLYPDAAQWKHNEDTIGHRIPEIEILHRNLPIGSITKHIIWYICKRLHIHDFYNTELQNEYIIASEHIFQEYFNDNKLFLVGLGKIAERIEEQYHSANLQDKVQALSVLAAIKAIKEY